MRRLPLTLTLFSLLALPSAVADPVPGTADDRLVRANAFRSTARTGSLAAVVGELSRSAKAEILPEPPAVVGIPHALAEPIAALAAAVREADSVVRAAVPAEHRPAVLRALALSRTPEGVAPDGRVDPAMERIASHVDLDSMLAASHRIAAAVDALLEVPRPASNTAAAPACDIVNQTPLLCVSSAGEQTYTTDDHWMIVDLGGNDVYQNHVGVGACVGDPQDNEREPCVGLGVDLGGDDRYETPGLFLPCEADGFGPEKGICAQGAGILGIGMLIDAEGSDTYEATGLPKTDPSCLDGNFAICGVIDAQASGRFGVGVLADLSGDDSYRVAFPLPAADAPSDRNVTLSGQASAVFGAALLWDDGGDDTYEVTGPATGYPTATSVTGWSNYSAQGVAVLAQAVVLESGGRDSFLIRAEPGPGAGDRTSKSPYGEGGATFGSSNGGQGIGLPGFNVQSYGAIIEGEGDTQYRIDMSARFDAEAKGQGYYTGGLIDDAGGDDLYRVSASVDVSFDRFCDCEEASESIQVPHDPLVEGQGMTQGLLRDHDGDDVYELLGSGSMSLTVTNRSETGSATADLAAGGPAVFGQGMGTGVLRDDGGDDRYLARGTEVAGSIAEGNGDRRASARARVMSVVAQGSAGHLVDLGGLDDYRVEALGRATAEPAAPGAIDEGYYRVEGHGLTGDHGGITDVDGGQLDRFTLHSPELFNMCGGSYGEAPGWAGGVTRRIGDEAGPEQCSTNRARSNVSSAAPVGAPASLQLLSVGRTGEDRDVVRAVARLTDASGAPLAGRRVRLSAQMQLGEPYYGIGPMYRWYDQSSGAREAVTDAEGNVEVTFPILACDPSIADCVNGRRIRAMFFGEPGAYRPAYHLRALPS